MIIDGQSIEKGENKLIKIKAGNLPSGNSISISAHIFRSKKDGPTVLVQGGVHGDEINGIEIVRSAIDNGYFNDLKSGTVIAIPLLNVYGFINFSRTVPDGKDVNRSFPGNSKGSLAARIARKLTKHILPYVDYAIDYHTGGSSRYNWPQTRYSINDPIARELALVFNANCTIQKPMINNSFRKIAHDMNIPTIIFEGGESVRLDTDAIQFGKEGMKRVLGHLGLISNPKKTKSTSIFINKTNWIRASHSGIFIWTKKSGSHIKRGELLGHIYDPYASKTIQVLSPKKGILIGHNNASVVNQGDALFNIGLE